MKVRINREHLVGVLSVITQALPGNRNILPIWESLLFNIKDGKCHIYARSEEIQVKAFCNVVADEDHSFCIPGQLFYQTVKLMSDEEIILTTKIKEDGRIKHFKTTMTVKGKKKRYGLSGADPEAYGIMRMDKEKAKGIKTKTESFLRAISRVSIIPNPTDIRPQFAGVSIKDKGNCVHVEASDNRTIVRMILPIEEELPEMMFRKNVANLLQVLKDTPDIRVGSDGTHIFAQAGNYTIMGALIGTSFPDIQPFFEGRDQDMYIIMNRNEVIDAIKRLRLYSLRHVTDSVSENVLKVDIKGQTVELSAVSISGDHDGMEELLVENNRVEDMLIGFDPKLLIQALDRMESERIRVLMRTHKDICFFYEEGGNKDPEQCWLIAPMLLDENRPPEEEE